jgi:L-ascorbate metabolism protein UlaG (beta-lactamase superfamily)
MVTTGLLIGLILAFMMGVFIFTKTAHQFGKSAEGKALKRIQASKNYNGEVFVNLIPTHLDMNVSKLMRTIREFWAEKNKLPPGLMPTNFTGGYTGGDSTIYLTWFGHSAILIEIEGKKIFFDPMLGPASSPVSFTNKRFDYREEIDFDEIPELDAIILSHDHFDHLDYGSILKLKDKTNMFFAPIGVGSHLVYWGVPAEKVMAMDWWESTEFMELELICTPSRHFSGRGLTDRNATLWASWVLKGKHESVYFSGDSGYGPHFKEIGKKYGPFKLSMIECGQYNEKWADIHMMPEESVKAGEDLNSEMIMPIHWAAFNLAPHTWNDPIIRASKEAEKRGLDLISPVIGKRNHVGFLIPNMDWWTQPSSFEKP